MSLGKLACPACERTDKMWENITGWRSVRETVVYPSGARVSRGDGWEINDQEPTGEMGCSCGWEGLISDLVQLGTDGKPLPDPLPGQERLA